MKPNRKRIYIGGTRYTVGTRKKIGRHPGLGPNVYIMGQFRPQTHEIVYLSKLGESRNLTLIHEILHAIEHEFCIGLDERDVDVISREITGSLGQLGIIK